MSDMRVIAPLVIVKDAAGKQHYRYREAIIPEGSAAAGELERLLARGLVAPVAAPSGAQAGEGSVDVGDEMPSGGVKDVINWVGIDQVRASRALQTELARPSPRKGVVDPLHQLLGLPPAGAPSPAGGDTGGAGGEDTDAGD